MVGARLLGIDRNGGGRGSATRSLRAIQPRVERRGGQTARLRDARSTVRSPRLEGGGASASLEGAAVRFLQGSRRRARWPDHLPRRRGREIGIGRERAGAGLPSL